MSEEQAVSGSSEMTAERTNGGPDAAEPEPRTSRLGGDFWSRYGVLLALLVMVGFFIFASDNFLTQTNLVNILRQSAVVAIAAVGATKVLISGGIDISQGAVMAFAGLTSVVLIEQYGMPDLVAIGAALAIALVFGMANGLLAEIVRIPAFIATLGTALVIRGIAFVYTEGRSIGLSGGSGEILAWLGRGFIGPLPVPVVLMLLLYVVATWIMSRTTWGLHTYAIGSAERAARIAGVRVARHRIEVYAVAGLLSGLAGVVLAGRLASAAPGLATGAEFDILTAVVLGGTSIYGGRGNVPRTLLGAVFLATMTNGLILLNVPTFYQTITVGVVLLTALSLDRLRSRRGR
jgi:ribose/xylose/arabinose/galactoside ABC-type transport system permease subunit